MVWSTKGIGGLPLAVLCAFYRQKVSITLHGTQVTSILKHVIIASHSSSKLITFSSFSFRFLIPFQKIYTSCDWWGLWNIICSFALYDPLWLYSFHPSRVLCICSFFPSLLGALFNGVCHHHEEQLSKQVKIKH